MTHVLNTLPTQVYGLGLAHRVGAEWIRVRALPAAVQYSELALRQSAGGSRVPTGGKESEYVTSVLRHVHDSYCIGIGADDVQAFAIGTDGECTGCHTDRLPWCHGHVNGFHQLDLVRFGNAD